MKIFVVSFQYYILHVLKNKMASVTKNVLLSDIYILQINLPQSVSERYYHSLSVYTVGLNCVWIVVTGGCAERREETIDKYRDIYVSHPNIAMVIELGK